MNLRKCVIIGVSLLLFAWAVRGILSIEQPEPVPKKAWEMFNYWGSDKGDFGKGGSGFGYGGGGGGAW